MSVNITQRTLVVLGSPESPGVPPGAQKKAHGSAQILSIPAFSYGGTRGVQQICNGRGISSMDAGHSDIQHVNEDVFTSCCILIILINLFSALLVFVN